MKATCSAKELAAALKVTSPAALTGARLAVEDGVMDVTCTNYDQTITATLPLDTWENGEVVVPAKVANALVATLGDDVTLELADDRLVVTSGDAVARLWLLPTDEWPRFEEIDTAPAILSTEAIADLRKLAKSMGADPTRPKFYGAYFAGRHAWASDSYRVAAVRLGDVDVPEAHLPTPVLASALAAIAGNAELTVGTNRAELATGATTWSTRLVDTGGIPDGWEYLHGFGKPASTFTFDGGALRSAVRRIISIGIDDLPAIDIDLADGSATLRSVTRDVGEVVDRIDVEGGGTEAMTFNARYLLDMIETDGRDELTLMVWPEFHVPVVADNGTMAQGLMRVRRPKAA